MTYMPYMDMDMDGWVRKAPPFLSAFVCELYISGGLAPSEASLPPSNRQKKQPSSVY